MKTFSLNNLVFIALIALFVMSGLSLFVAAPVAFINWFWNAVVATYSGLPPIGICQSGLLYAALVCVLYISDLVHVEIKAEKIN